MSYETWQSTDLAPPWLQRTALERAPLETVGAGKDELADRLRQGVKARFASTAPADALAEIGADAGGLEQAPGETDAAFRLRLAALWSFWGTAGTETAIQTTFAALGLPATSTVVLGSRSGCFGYPSTHWSRIAAFVDGTDPDGVDWQIDSPWGGAPAVPPGSPLPPMPTWGDGGVWGMYQFEGTTILDYMARSLRKFRSAFDYPLWIWIAVNDGTGVAPVDTLWGCVGTWGDGGDWTNAPCSRIRRVVGHSWGEEAVGPSPGATDTWGRGTWGAW